MACFLVLFHSAGEPLSLAVFCYFNGFFPLSRLKTARSFVGLNTNSQPIFSTHFFLITFFSRVRIYPARSPG
jgi:hypothetical protein